MSIFSQDIEGKRNIGVNQRPLLWYKFGKKDVYQYQARSCQYESIYNLGENMSMCSHDIEEKRKFGVNQV